MISDNGKTYRLGSVSGTDSQNPDWVAALGNKTVKNFTVQNYASIAFNNATSLRINNLNIGANSTITINSGFANHPILSAQGGTTYINTDAVTFSSVNIGTAGSATITAYGFSNSWNGSSYANAPAAGNGKLILNVDGAVTIGSSGTIQMNYAGYAGGAVRASGYSMSGPGTDGAGLSDGSNQHSAASYATLGGNYGMSPGSLYGASDFWTALYLGSGGAGSWSYAGGAGGGAIAINASSLTNSGTISSVGAGASNCYEGGQGSGGTIYVNLAGAYTNSGTVSVKGGENCNGRVGGDGRLKIDAGTAPVTSSAVVDGGGNSNVDGTLISCSGSSACGSSNPWVIPEGMTLPNLIVSNGAWVKISQSVSIGNIIVKSGGVLVVDAASPLAISGDLTILAGGTLTGSAFSSTWNGSSYSANPGPGNGQLVLQVAGQLHNEGTIHMNGAGYVGGVVQSSGYSVAGPGTGGAGIINPGDPSWGSAGSYATPGSNYNAPASSTFGATDFWTQLYLGSGGAGGGWSWCGNTGGSGGGAISITAGSMSNFGTISANGNAGSGCYGDRFRSGSGGTLYFNVSSTFANSGTISVQGGQNNPGAGGMGRVRIDTGSLADSQGTIYGIVHSSIANKLSQNVSQITLDSSQLVVSDGGNIYRLGNVSGNASENSDWAAALGNRTVADFNVQNSAAYAFNNVTALRITRLNVSSSATVVINSAFANHPELSAQGGKTYVNTDAVAFSSVTIGTVGAATLTASGYSATWNGPNYSSMPAAGNGRLILNVDGALTVGNVGTIHMNGAGYAGGAMQSSGYSIAGPGTGGAGIINPGDPSWGSAGSYGTQGNNYNAPASSTFGATDFWTQLYLGSGGAGGGWSYCGNTGGSGGGAISIAAGSMSNSGTISANGNAGSGCYGDRFRGGSGGTLYFNVGSTFANSGTISAQGGQNNPGAGGLGRVRIDAGTLAESLGTIYGIVHSNIANNLSQNISQVTLDSSQLVISDGGNIYRLGNISGNASENSDWAVALGNRTVADFNVQNSAAYAFNNVTALRITRLNVSSSAAVVINSAFANHPELAAQGGTTYVNTDAVAFSSVTIGTLGAATLTASGYSATWNGSNYSSMPAAGNGRLILNVDGALTVGNVGTIHMNGAGYAGGVLQNPGYSIAGPGTGGAGIINPGDPTWSSAGSYGTQGNNYNAPASSTFGATDFWTQLYLGSGGAGGGYIWCGNSGGAGGGAISIAAGSVSNSGTISASGNPGSGCYGDRFRGGSGGTLYFNVVSTFANSGTISVQGGQNNPGSGGLGRVRIDAGTLSHSPGVIYGLVHSNLSSKFSSSLTSITYDMNQLSIYDSGSVYNLGSLSAVESQNYDWVTFLNGKQIKILNVNNANMSLNKGGAYSIKDVVVRNNGALTLSNATGIDIKNLSNGVGGTLIVNSALANHPVLAAQGGTTYVNTDAVTFASVELGTLGSGATITANGFAGTWNGTAYSSAPAAGNGQLILKVDGSVTVGNAGVIHMNGAGYAGGPQSSAGYSVAGPDTYGAGRPSWSNGGGGSYATLGRNIGSGTGSVYGAQDFWSQLYLGSGGGGYQWGVGGAGGGAVKLMARSLTNSGTISANGANGNSWESGGSGGTLYLAVSGSVNNAGSFSVVGGNGGGLGRVKVDSSELIGSPGAISGIVDRSIIARQVVTGSKFTFDGSQMVFIDNGVSQTIDFANSSAWQSAITGKTISEFTVSGSSALTFSTATNVKIGALTVSDGAQITFSNANTIEVERLVVGTNAILTINSAFANHPVLSADGGTTYINTDAVAFSSIDLGTMGSATLTANGFNGSWTSGAYSTAPGAGNGRLVVNVDGDFTVGSLGTLSMDAKGYQGGASSQSGYSIGGPGTSGAGRSNGSGGYSSGSYATPGISGGTVDGAGGDASVGSVYGASDFWTALYLGSGGAGAASSTGGSGGGAIAVNAGSFTNLGTVSAKGSGGSVWTDGNGGSGGTLYFNVVGPFANLGSISTKGGESSGNRFGGLGRIRISAGALADSPGTMSGLVHSNILSTLSANISSFRFDPDQIVIVDDGNTYQLGNLSVVASQNHDWEAGFDAKTIDSFAVVNGSTFTFANSSAISIHDLIIESTVNVNHSGVHIDRISTRTTSALLSVNAAFANHPALSAEGGTTNVNSDSVHFASVDLGFKAAATLTASGFAGVWNGSAYSSIPGAGNGKLLLNVDNALNIGSSGVIQMNGKGYPGGAASSDGFSLAGPGVDGAGRSAGGANYSAGSYSTLGGTHGASSGSVYGNADYWTMLYLGSGGAGGVSATGGSGGGAIAINAGSVRNYGTVSATGGAASTSTDGAPGSGGTLYFNVQGAFTNNGNVLVSGGVNAGSLVGGMGRTKIDFGSNLSNNAIVYGPTGDSNIDGAPIDCGNGAHCAIDTPWVIPDGTTLSSLTVSYGAWVKISNDVNIANILVENGGVLIVDSAGPVSISGNLTVFNGGTVTGANYTSTWTGSEFTAAPGLGNGQFALQIGGDLMNDGTIHMNGAGYRGGLAAAAGHSMGGPNTYGAGKYSSGNAGGGSYATSGSGAAGLVGSVYGASDFWQNLYLGSGGGGSSAGAGGAGGGALSIAARSILNTGIISATGNNGDTSSNGGSGGTIYLKTTSEFTNKGTLTVAGGNGGGYGRVRLEAGSLVGNTGMIYGLVHSNIGQKFGANLDSFDFDTQQIQVFEDGYLTNLGILSSVPSENYDWTTSLEGKTIASLTVDHGARLDFSHNTSLSIGTAAAKSNSYLSFTNASNFNVTHLSVGGSSTLVLGSGFSSHPSLSAQGGTTYVNTANINFASVALGTEGSAAVLTTSAFSGSWNGAAYTSVPGAGNGKLILRVDGAVNIGQSGSILVNGAGYAGGTAGNHGLSLAGVGTYGGGRFTAGSGGGGSYGTAGNNAGGGASAVYGADDFWTALYLGSGGGGNNASSGGAGGGAISITAASLSNAGAIFAKGANGNQSTNGGSGGTLYVNLTGAFGNTGTLSVAGGTGGGYGRVRVDAGSYLNSPGTIDGPTQSNMVDRLSAAITSVTFDTNQLVIFDRGKYYNLGTLSSDSSQNQDWQSLLSGKTIQVINVVNSMPLTFSDTTHLTVGTVNVSNSSSVTFNNSSTNSINKINVGYNSTLAVNSAFANHPILSAQGGTTYINSSTVAFASVDLGTQGSAATLTAGGFGGTWDPSSSAYSSAPAAGNGRLILNVDGAVTIGSNGNLQMNGAGYSGGSSGDYNGNNGGAGYSVAGLDTYGAGKWTWNNGGGGSYATLGSNVGAGTGSVYGASDFWTQLYLGSGGSGYRWGGGGAGGGAIAINAGSLSNAGMISATGANGGGSGGGSGGTLFVNLSGAFSNFGTLSVAGGNGGGSGRVRIDTQSLITHPGSINGIVHSNLISHLSSSSVSINFDTNQLVAFDNEKYYTMGTLSSTSSQNQNWESLLSGKNIQVLNVINSMPMTFNSTSNLTVGTLNISNSSSVTFNAASTISINKINVGYNSTLVVNSAFANHPILSAQGGTTYVNSATAAFASIDLGTQGSGATLTSGGFSGTWDSINAVYSSSPAAGNGRLILNVDGAVTVGANGTLHMNGVGYPGGSAGDYNGNNGGAGYSVAGLDTYGAGKWTWNNGGGGSYATLGSNVGAGTGSVYGTSDFWTQLYLGSGGSGYRWGGGGAGGGAIAINAGSLSNAGMISATGANGGGSGGGSGGTLFVNLSGAFSNVGTLSVAGGNGGGYGRVRINTTSLTSHPGAIYGLLHSNIIEHFSNALTAVYYDTNQLVIFDTGKYYNLGILSGTIAHNQDWQLLLSGKTIQALTLNNSAPINFTTAQNLTIGTLSVANGSSVTFTNTSTISINKINVGYNSTLVVNSAFANHPILSAQGGTTYVNSAAAAFASVDLGTQGSAATLTAGGFSGTWDPGSSAYSSAPSAGNGRLILNVDGALTIGSSGTVHMNGAGYPGGSAGDYNGNNGGAGYSVAGLDTYGAGKWTWSNGGGGSYATLGTDAGGGTGSVYGAGDFWTQLYLGSGGSGNRWGTGGAGGGAIAINANALDNSGVISATGANGSGSAGGSGGTLYLNLSGAFSNIGRLSVAGGSGGGYGRLGITYGTTYNDYRGTFTPAITCDGSGGGPVCHN